MQNSEGVEKTFPTQVIMLCRIQFGFGTFDWKIGLHQNSCVGDWQVQMALWLGMPTLRLFFSDKLVILSRWPISPPLVENSGGVYGEFCVKVMYMENDCHIRGNCGLESLDVYLYICRILELACWVYDLKKTHLQSALFSFTEKKSFHRKKSYTWDKCSTV